MTQKHKNNFYLKNASWKIDSIIGGLELPEKELDKSEVFLQEFSNFRRLDSMSKAVCSSIAVLLKQIDLYPIDKKLSIPIFFNNPEGTINSDANYYRDFLEFDESSGRANFFLYTLPTSPLGEASVHFGLTGSIVYITSLTPLKTICETILNSREDYSDGVLLGIGECDDQEANSLFIYLVKDETGGISLDEVLKLEYNSVSELKEKLYLK